MAGTDLLSTDPMEQLQDSKAEILSTDERFVSTVVDSRERLRWRWQICVFLASILIIVARRPDAIFSPQFYGEDGAVWFAGAYNHGWLQSLFVPEGGYLLLIPRLAAGLPLLVPFHLAPLVLNAVGIVAQVMPAAYLISDRCAKLATLRLRFALAASYLLLPNAIEIHVTVTNAEWHSAVLLFLVMISPAISRWDRLFDILTIVLAGLTGPFSLVLLPVAAIVWCKDRTQWSRTRIYLLAATAVIQASSLALHIHVRHNPLGATLDRFLDIVGGQIFFGTVLGYNSLAWAGPHAANVAAAVIGSALFVYFVLSVRRLELTLFALFAVCILAASLYSPLLPGQPAWKWLKAIPGGRYWYFPTLAFTWSAIWCLFDSARQLPRALAVMLLSCMVFGFVLDFRLPRYEEIGFREQAIRFERAPRGTHMRISLVPFPQRISMLVIKH